ncbi:MAG TPA: proline--tRNA ligase [Fibrobacteria bacterium]|nr:proline--tRNA ligase [Fibrobacteria bacterium]
MRVSKFVVKTLREAPAGAELPSHVFLLRGGYVKPLASGLYSMLPLGKRVLQKIESVIREEMNAIAGQEVELPLAQPAELWDESGRGAVIGAELLRFKDRSEHPMVLAMTHEEAVTDLARYFLSSYKQLPFMLYQFQLKFRDEPRSRGGLVRVREFTMKDAYSFHRTAEDLDTYYERAYKAYERIFARAGIKPVIVQSDTGIMGGKVAHEFMLETEHGEDYLILSEDGNYSANQEIAAFDRESAKEAEKAVEKVATPGKKTIDEVTGFLKTDKKHAMKAVLFETDSSDGGRVLVLALVRGDLEASDVKIRNHLKARFLLPAQDDFIRSFGIIPGFASPVGIAPRKDLVVLVDKSIAEGNNFVGGANEEDHHLVNVNFGRDFTSENVGDFAKAESGHLAPDGKSRLKAVRGIEIGNIFKLGTKFTESMNCAYLDEAGKHQVPIMGCYGIGVGRLMAAAIENSHDDFGPIWPSEITPYHVHLVNIGQEPEVVAACEALMAELEGAGIEVLYDDRDERPGVKFKDADLWGIPVRVAIGKKTLANEAGPSVEWKLRREKEFSLVPVGDVQTKLLEWYASTCVREQG